MSAPSGSACGPRRRTTIAYHGRDWDRAVVATAQFGIRLPPYRYEGVLFTLTTEGVVRRVSGLRLAEGDDKLRRLRALLADVRACSGLEGLAVERVCRLTDMTPRDRAEHGRGRAACGARPPPSDGENHPNDHRPGGGRFPDPRRPPTPGAFNIIGGICLLRL